MGDLLSRHKFSQSWSPWGKGENQAMTPFKMYVLSSASACVAEMGTYPLDMLKTRKQLQSELKMYDAVLQRQRRSPIRERNAIGLLIDIVRKEGIFKLWSGATPAVIRQIGFTGTRVTVYEELRVFMGKNADGSFDLWKAMVAGLFGGAFAQFLVSPTDLIKIQMQIEGQRIAEGKKPRMRNSWDAFKKILRTTGLTGLWAGWRPNVHTAALINMGGVGVYDVIKHSVMNDMGVKNSFWIQSVSSVLSSLFLAITVTPSDMVKTRLLNQPRDRTGSGMLYTNSLDCVIKVVKNEGFFSLYSGFWPFYIRLVPWTWIFWLTYEASRSFFGTEAF